MSSAKLDKLLAEWPGPEERSSLDWDEAAERVVAKLGDPPKSSGVSDDVLLAPPLPAVAGEGGLPSVVSAENKMSKERRNRGSFSDLAKLAGTPPPPATSSPSPSLTPTPPPTGVTRAEEASGDDSGIVDLKIIASLDPAAEARAQSTPLANEGLFDDDKPASAPAAAPSSKPKPVASVPASTSTPPPSSAAPASASASAPPAAAAAVAAPAPAKKKEGSGGTILLLFGGVVGLAAVAAGAFFYVKSQRLDLPEHAQVAVDKPKDLKPLPTASSIGPATDTPVATADTPVADPDPGKKAPTVKPTLGGPGFKPTAPTASVDPKLVVKDLPQNQGGGGSDLNSAMAAAAGPIASSAGPASTGGGGASGNVPQKPSQGMVQGAINAVLPQARQCLGPDDPRSIASVVFQSDGTVKSVTISGGNKGAEGCIKDALSKAKVQPFAEATFAFPVTVRPTGS